MTIRFYLFRGQNDLIGKIKEGTPFYETTGTMRDRCDVMDPVFDVSMTLGSGDDRDPLRYNYAYIVEFDRYYFIVKPPEMIRTGLCRIYMHEDVLNSFETQIRNAPDYVIERNSNAVGINPDPLVPLELQRRTKTRLLFNGNSPFTDSTPSSNITRVCFVLNIGSKDSVFTVFDNYNRKEDQPQQISYPLDTGFGSTSYIGLGYYGVRDFFTALWNNNFVNDLKNIFAQKTSSIISLTAFPIDFSIFESGNQRFVYMTRVNSDTDNTTVYIGNYGMSLYRPWRIHYSRLYNLGSFTLQSVSEVEGQAKFYQRSPAATYSIYMPFVGWRNLPDNIMNQTTEYQLKMAIDLRSNTVIYYLVDPGKNMPLCKWSGSCGYRVPISFEDSSSRNQEKFMNAINVGISALAAGAGAATGVAPVTGAGIMGLAKSAASGAAHTLRSDPTSVFGSSSEGDCAFDPLGFVLRYDYNLPSVDMNNIRKTFGLVNDGVLDVGGLPYAQDVFVKFARFHIENYNEDISPGFAIPCKNEADEIESLMTKGVHF